MLRGGTGTGLGGGLGGGGHRGAVVRCRAKKADESTLLDEEEEEDDEEDVVGYGGGEDYDQVGDWLYAAAEYAESTDGGAPIKKPSSLNQWTTAVQAATPSRWGGAS